jgi:myo-inositol-1(or 4)-monophosphatase
MLEQVISIVRAAGEKMLSFRAPKVFTKEGHAKFVTECDLAVQTFLFTHLHPLLPEAVFFAEEQENQPMTDALTWVIDPIDGTTNLIHNRACSAISVALLKNKRPILAVVALPYVKRIYTAEQGSGAFCNGEPISVGHRPLREAIVSFGTSPYYTELADRSLALAKTFLRCTADIRRTGSAAVDLCDMASGNCDIFFELRLSPWDFAAGALLIQEAGGFICGLNDDGTPVPLSFDRPSGLLACAPEHWSFVEQLITAE